VHNKYPVKVKFELIQQDIVLNFIKTLTFYKEDFKFLSEEDKKDYQKKLPNILKYDFKLLEKNNNLIMIDLFSKMLTKDFFKRHTDFEDVKEFIKYYPLQLSSDKSKILDYFINEHLDSGSTWNHFVIKAYDFSLNK
jgi:archaellum biogenesis ATPase FlaH